MPDTRLCIIVALTAVLTACGGGTQNVISPLAPVFTSTPPSQASEGIVYSYSISATDPAGGSMTFTLSDAPQGAALAGSTLSWTPSGAQSRISDAFTITARSSEGGHATQSWNVIPAGTVSGSWINTRWTASGSSNLPFDWTKSRFQPQALVPRLDGSFTTIAGSGNSDGAFSIPNVPGGYYWLQIGRSSYWTSSSTIDLGTDRVGVPIGTIPTNETTTFAFDINGLDPVQTGDQFAFLTDWDNPFSVLNIGFAIPAPDGSTSMTATYRINSNIDFSTADIGYLLQYEPVSAGSITGVALGPELTVPNLSLTSGITNNIDATLNPSPQFSFDLSVKGSQWAPMFQNVGPGAVTPTDAYISMSARPFAPAAIFGSPLNLPLFLPPLISNFGFLVGWPTAGTCGSFVVINPQEIITSYSPILSDQDFGTLSYADPFDPNWGRVFSLCQTASVEVPVPGGGPPATFYFQDGVNTAIPSSPVSPLALPVQNPTINGGSFFSAATINPNAVALNWSQPAGTSPFTYKLELIEWTTRPDGSQGYEGVGRFYTGKTSLALPPLQAGQTYVFVLSTEVDGRANVETMPQRSALPTADAMVVSAPITTSSASRHNSRRIH